MKANKLLDEMNLYRGTFERPGEELPELVKFMEAQGLSYFEMALGTDKIGFRCYTDGVCLVLTAYDDAMRDDADYIEINDIGKYGDIKDIVKVLELAHVDYVAVSSASGMGFVLVCELIRHGWDSVGGYTTAMEGYGLLLHRKWDAVRAA